MNRLLTLRLLKCIRWRHNQYFMPKQFCTSYDNLSADKNSNIFKIVDSASTYYQLKINFTSMVFYAFKVSHEFFSYY